VQRLTIGARCVALLVALFLICCGTPDTVPPRTSAEPGGSSFGEPAVLVLTASEPAMVYVSFSGTDPEIADENTISGESPLRIELPEGVTEVRFFSIDLSGNRELGIRVEVYLVDTTPPDVALTGDAPEPLGLLEIAAIAWQVNETCDYRVERGGDGQPESGELLEEGTLDADVAASIEVAAIDLPDEGTLSIWIHARDWTGRVGSLEIPLERATPIEVSWPHSPGDVVVLPDGDRAYVAHRFGQEVDVIDLDPESPTPLGILNVIDVGVRPWKLALTPDGSRVYVSNVVAPGAIAVIETDSDTATATLSGVGIPGPVAFAPDGDRGYFTDYEGRIVTLDTDPLSASYHGVIDSAFIHESLLSGVLAVSPDRSRVVLNWSGSSLHGCELIEADPVDGSLTGVIASPTRDIRGGAGDVVLASDGEFGYVTSSDPDRALFRLDLATGTIDSAITMDEITGETADTIDVILGGQHVADLQAGLALTSDDQYLFSVGPNGDTLKLYGADTLEELARTTIGGGAVDIAITPDGTRALITRSGLEPALVVVKLR